MTESYALLRLADITAGRVKCGDSEIAELKSSAANLISEIPDANLRFALQEKYIHGISWDKVADQFCFGSSDMVRKRCMRYLDMLRAKAN